MAALPRLADEAHPHAALDHVTPYDRFAALSDDDVERLLASGEQRQELETFFGAGEYRDLAALARTAQRTKRRADACRAIIVPGIMGSQLGLPRRAPLPRDVLWLDPVDIGSGRLRELVLPGLPGTARLEPCGVVLYSYLRLKLHLRAAGHDAAFHAYDWRLGVDDLGRELALRLTSEPPGRLALVGHSLGGLVCRAALALASGPVHGAASTHGGGNAASVPTAARVERVVLLGTPNGGTFAPVQALRGTYAVVRKFARLDSLHSASALAAGIFRTFPSLYHMLPKACGGEAPDLLDPAAWPQSGPHPEPHLLESARQIGDRLAPADERFAVVVGVGRATVTAVSRRRDDFTYTVKRLGDGTVPAERAHLDGARHFYASASHSDLTRDETVARAVIDLLNGGATRRLTSTWRTRSRAVARISDRELSRLPAGKVDWTRLTPEERRGFLQNLNEPPRLRLRVPAATRTAAANRGRR
ncbi:MAG: esterase/lipase family protein [Steroidobacteraceae bacterium]